MIDTAMILAAGKGTRMRAVAHDPPKPLVRIGGKPLLDHMLARLAEVGVRRVVINIHHKAAMIEKHLAASNWPFEIIFSDEREKILETGGGVKHALPHLGKNPFFVCNADVLWQGGDNALTDLVTAYRPPQIRLLLARRDTAIGYERAGDFDFVKNDTLCRRQQKTARYVFAGVQILDGSWFDGVTCTVFSLNKIFDAAIAAGVLRGGVLDGVWMHVGSREARAAAEAYFREQNPRHKSPVL